MGMTMDPTSASAPSSDTAIAYEATMARRAQDQQRVEGAAALRLIEGSVSPGGEARPLPPDATISIRA
jgi:hypothetical protein